ncbi:MAG: N-acetyl-gamma-glutamyl-phosphate reductase [Lawsonella sp.]
MTISVAVAGATGYAGCEILRLLLGHPAYHRGELTIGALCANRNAGQRVGEFHPHLAPLADRQFDKTSAGVLAGHDVVFMALPHGHSGALAKELTEKAGDAGGAPVVIDCAADFRLRDAAAWEKWYESPHQGTWPYGLPELANHREALKTAKTVAVPGCFPTGASLAMYPAVAAGITSDDLTFVSFTGTSGAGRGANVLNLHAEVSGSAKAYKLAGRHRHTPEILQNMQALTDQKLKISFTPVLAPMPRGILTTAITTTSATAEEAQQIYENAYQNEPFVQVLPYGQQPMTKSVLGSNNVQIAVDVDPDSQKLIVTSAIDNLVKGTAGGAVQCMNIVLGWDETDGLSTVGVAP